MKQQSVWVQWADLAEPFDLSWKILIWGNLSPYVIKFVLAASVNWVRTPDLLHLWSYKQTCYCCLCGASKCTLHHILSNCSFAFKDKRYTWKNDCIFNLIAQTLQDHLSIVNSQVNNPVQLITFVKAGDSNPPKWKHKAALTYSMAQIIGT